MGEVKEGKAGEGSKRKGREIEEANEGKECEGGYGRVKGGGMGRLVGGGRKPQGFSGFCIPSSWAS